MRQIVITVLLTKVGGRISPVDEANSNSSKPTFLSSKPMSFDCIVLYMQIVEFRRLANIISPLYFYSSLLGL